MAVRPFDWRDLPTLHRYRHNSVFLDSALILTRGPMLVSRALFSYLAPSIGLFTCVYNGSQRPPLIGQAMHNPGAPLAHLTFLTPDEGLESPAIPDIVEYLAMLVGERGAFHLLAEVD